MSKFVTSTIRFPERIESWIQGRIKETGVSKNAIVVLAMEEYIDQKQALKDLGISQQLIERLQEIKKNGNVE